MVDTIKFSEMMSGGDLENNDKIPGLKNGSNVLFNNPWTFLPPGPTSSRPVIEPLMYNRLRFNTDTNVYEYYNPNTSMWVQLSSGGGGNINPGVANDLAFYAVNGTTITPIPGAPNAVLVTNGIKTPSLSTMLPQGLTIPNANIINSVATLNAGSVSAAPVNGNDIANKNYVDTLVNSGVRSITGTTNQINASSSTGNVVLSLPQDIALGSTPSFAGVTLTSIPLGVSSGGTGVNTVPVAPVGSMYAAWDVNKNFRANAFIPGFSTISASGGTTTLTIASPQYLEITGTLAQTVQLPSAGTLLAGHTFYIINNSSSNVTVNSSGGNLVLTLAANTSAIIVCVLASGTSASSWNASYIFDNGASVLSITGSPNQIIASSSTGNVTLSLPQDISTYSDPVFGSLNFSTITGLVGRANATPAPPGSVGEFISNTVNFASALTMTSSVVLNVTSILLTPGNWEASGCAVFIQGTAGNTSTVDCVACVIETSASIGEPYLTVGVGADVASGTPPNVGNRRVPTSSAAIFVAAGTTKTVYLTARSAFLPANSIKVYGSITARRVC